MAVSLPAHVPSLPRALACLSLDMESAIKTIVTTYLSSARGKDSLDGKSFQKLVKKQLGGIMEVRPHKAYS